MKMESNDDESFAVGKYSHIEAKQLFDESYSESYLEYMSRKDPSLPEIMFSAFCHGLAAAQKKA